MELFWKYLDHDSIIMSEKDSMTEIAAIMAVALQNFFIVLAWQNIVKRQV